MTTQNVAAFSCEILYESPHRHFVVACSPDEECEYCPDRALSAALKDWMEELNQPLQAGIIYTVYI